MAGGYAMFSSDVALAYKGFMRCSTGPTLAKAPVPLLRQLASFHHALAEEAAELPRNGLDPDTGRPESGSMSQSTRFNSMIVKRRQMPSGSHEEAGELADSSAQAAVLHRVLPAEARDSLASRARQLEVAQDSHPW